MSKIKFVGLHAHSCTGSPFDGLGYPAEHMDFAFKNGSDALALTDHGNMNGLAYQVLHAKKMEKDGKDFKPIYGVEAYIHPSIEQWKEDKARIDAEKKSKKKADEASFVLEDEEASKKAVKDVLNHRRHIVLLAQNQKGLNNIFKLISTSFSEDYYYRFPRIDYELLKQHNEGIIASSACLGGVYAKDMWANLEDGMDAVYEAMCQTTESMLDIFGDRWYGELQWNSFKEQHDLNQLVIKVCKEYNVPLVSTADSHYPEPELWKDRILYKKLGWLNKSDEIPSLPQSVEETRCELYPKNGEQMWESYKKTSNLFGQQYDDDLIRESFENTYNIAHERIERFYPDNTVRLPDFVVPEDSKSATFALSKMAIAGLKEKGLHKDNEYVERLKHELKVINDRNFSKYFLTMKSISDLAKEDRLTGPGRGSAAGALLSYVLGITQVDPIKYGLQFERFMRRDQTNFPDIDFDVASPMDFKEKLIDKWGSNVVVPISNFNTLQPKSLIKDISKFYGLNFQDVNKVTSVMEEEAIPRAKEMHGIKAGVYKPTFNELKEFSESLKAFLAQYPDIATHVDVLRGQVRSQSRHAGGVVIGQNLDYYMPLVKSGGVTQTPWSEGQRVHHLEPMGFIKYDILGLLTLEMVQSTIELILRRKHGYEPTFEEVTEFYDKHLNPEYHDFDDPAVYKHVFQDGNFAATFQFSENFAKKACTLAKPESIVDLATLTSILRPGPMSAKVDKKYIDARNDPTVVRYAHDEVKKVTEETYGFLVFQEQIAALAHNLGKDISLEEGNKLRKILTKNTSARIGKRVPSEEENKIHAKFIEGCLEKGISKATGEAIWESFIFFSAYGFNKSHAVCYSIISYMCAWLLKYYPAEWLASYLSHVDDKKQEEAISVAKQMGFRIGKLDINESEFRWQVGKDGKTLIPPLVSVKGVGEKAVVEIVKHKPYNTIEDLIFHEEISGRAVGKRVLDALTRAGALDELIDDRFTGSKHFWSAIAVDRPKSMKRFNENIENYRDQGEFSEAEKLLNIQSLTGNYPVRLVVSDELLDRLDSMHCPALGAWDPKDPLYRSDSGKALCWFIPYEKIVKKTKKRGKEYWVLKCVDLTGGVTEIKCWGITASSKIIMHRPYMAALDYDDKWGFSTKSVNRFRMIG